MYGCCIWRGVRPFQRAPHSPACGALPSVLLTFQSRPPPLWSGAKLSPWQCCPSSQHTPLHSGVTVGGVALPQMLLRLTTINSRSGWVCAWSSHRGWPVVGNQPTVVTNSCVISHLRLPLHLFQHALHICGLRHERQLHPPCDPLRSDKVAWMQTKMAALLWSTLCCADVCPHVVSGCKPAGFSPLCPDGQLYLSPGAR